MRKIFFTLLTVLLATLAAQASTAINVAGVDFNCDRDATITGGDIKSGTVTYTYSTNTLTLTNVTIYRTGSGAYCIHNRSNKNLIVKFVGTCNLTSTNARVIRFQCGGASSGYQCKLVAASGATVNMSSTNDGAIYVRDNTSLLIEGPGTFNITGQKDGAIAGHGSWNATSTDPTTKDYISFSNVTATVTGAQGSLLGLESVKFSAGSNVTLKATNNSSYLVVRQVKAFNLNNNTTILAPWGAYYTSSNQSVALNGSNVYSYDIFISDNYALLLTTTNFPDANFRNYMLQLYPKGYLTQSEVNDRTYLFLANKGISDMTGIEKLTALKDLRCYSNSFTSLDLSSNTALTYLDCAPNPQLTWLDIRYCTNLETLICYETGIDNLNLGRLSKLKVLNCRDTKLTYLDVRERPQLTKVDCSNCTSLTQVDISDNSALTELNASGCTALGSVICEDNALTTLNVTGNTELGWLFCDGNSNLATITGLADCTAITRLVCNGCALTDLSACNDMTMLNELNCSNNKITELRLAHKSLMEVNASNNPNLTKAEIYGNSILTSLIIRNCPALTWLICSDNNLTTLDVTGLTSLEYLGCYDNDNLASITSLASCASLKDFQGWSCAITDLSALNSLNNLEEVRCDDNNITSLTLTNKSKLKEVSAFFNTSLTTATITGNSALTDLDLSACPALTTLNCYNNALVGLSVGWEEGEDMALKTLKCYNNPDLSSITGLKHCKALQKLYCYNCALTELSAVNSMTNLDYLACYGNQLTSLTVTSKSKLTNLYCYNNPRLTTLTVANNSALKVLDIKNNTAMTTANCYSNALTTLTVTGNTALKSLNCYNNQLTSLNLQGCNALTTLYCYKNQISGSGMTTLVNTLPTRTASSPGTMRAIYNSNENNSMTAAQITTARGKYWNPKKYNGSAWVDMTASTRGDVNGDGNVNISDVTALIDYLLSGNASGINLDAADCNQSGTINISDVTALIDYLLSGSW